MSSCRIEPHSNSTTAATRAHGVCVRFLELSALSIAGRNGAQLTITIKYRNCSNLLRSFCIFCFIPFEIYSWSYIRVLRFSCAMGTFDRWNINYSDFGASHPVKRHVIHLAISNLLPRNSCKATCETIYELMNKF